MVSGAGGGDYPLPVPHPQALAVSRVVVSIAVMVVSQYAFPDESTALTRASSDPVLPAADQASHRLLARLMREYVRPYTGRLVWAMVLMVAAALTTAANAWLLEPAIDKIFVAKSETLLYLLPAVIVLVALLRGLALYGQSMLMQGAGQRIVADTQVRLYEHLIRSDLAFLHDVHSGELISRFLFDVNRLNEAVARAITGIAKDAVTAMALMAVMFYQDWQLAMIVVFIFPLAGIVIRKLGKRMRKASTRTQEETGKLSRHLVETLEAPRIIKAYGMEGYESARARVRVEARLKHVMTQIKTRSIASPLMETLGGIAVGVAILYGGFRGLSGDLSLGAFMSFLAALLMAYQPLRSLASLNASLQDGLAAAARIFALLDVPPSIVDAPGAALLSVSGGHIRFENVSFSYGGNLAAFDGVDLELEPGTTVALVGPSGAGKSTILNLVPRFYDIDGGRITIDGQELRQVTLKSLRQALALVSQDTVLFDDTVRANIAYGNPAADDAAIREAARKAAADDFIEALEHGYDTVVGENAVKLSGGQRQRLAIARAMLKDAPILLLDEATSALDSEAEVKVQAALAELRRGRTTLVIAHRLSTIMSADRIYVLDAGRVVEAGTHNELIARDGAYARLYRLQFADPDRAEAAVGSGAG